MDDFQLLDLAHGILLDLKKGMLPSTVCAWVNQPLQLTAGATHFGYVYRGESTLEFNSGSFTLTQGMYFSLPAEGTVSGGIGFVVSRWDECGFFQIGGPAEDKGRLRYIDGCTDSLLVSPVTHGDACLNLLHVPENVDQSSHTHPSLRAGLIVKGAGICRTPDGDVPLSPGKVFIIPAEVVHSFHTEHDALTIIAYHPDSDFGPTDESHPMIHKTFISEQN